MTRPTAGSVPTEVLESRVWDKVAFSQRPCITQQSHPPHPHSEGIRDVKVRTVSPAQPSNPEMEAHWDRVLGVLKGPNEGLAPRFLKILGPSLTSRTYQWGPCSCCKLPFLKLLLCTANQGSQQLLLSKSISCLNPFDLNSLRPVMARDSELGSV